MLGRCRCTCKRLDKHGTVFSLGCFSHHWVSCRRNPSNYVLRLGDHSRYRNEGTEQNIGASRVIKHPSYDSRRINNDIALIKLSRAAKINDRVSPACLPEANYIVPPGTTCYITGQFICSYFRSDAVFAQTVFCMVVKTWVQLFYRPVLIFHNF